jgi:hypothetical protein
MQELLALSGNPDWPLPTRHSGRRKRYDDIHIERRTLVQSLGSAFRESRLKMRRFTPHDTRSTAKAACAIWAFRARSANSRFPHGGESRARSTPRQAADRIAMSAKWDFAHASLRRSQKQKSGRNRALPDSAYD